MTATADILIYQATRIGSACGWALRNSVPIIGAIGGFAILFAWWATGGARRD